MAGADPGFVLGGGALVSGSTSTPINHTVFFFAEYQLHKKTTGHLSHLHPPPRFAPEWSNTNVKSAFTGCLSDGLRSCHIYLYLLQLRLA